MENYYRVSFTAQLTKFVLAFRNDCQIDVFWKKGEKIAQSSKVPFNAIAYFNEQLTINCNMVNDLQTNTFREKITKFEIVLYTEKGTKKVGEIRFDVAKYLNERLSTPKEYELALDKCPDKNARLSFKLSANVGQMISADTISRRSQQSVNVETLVSGNKGHLSTIILPSPTSTNPPPTKDSSQLNQVRGVRRLNSQASSYSESTSSMRSEGESAANRDLQAENKRMREKLKDKERLIRQNEELKKKIKNQQYQSVKELKEKIEVGRKEVERLQATLKRQILLEKQVKTIEDQIFKCKFQIMNAFNYANQRGGGKLMFQMQQACGLKEG